MYVFLFWYGPFLHYTSFLKNCTFYMIDQHAYHCFGYTVVLDIHLVTTKNKVKRDLLAPLQHGDAYTENNLSSVHTLKLHYLIG